MKKIILALAICLVAAACSITQTVNPILEMNSGEVCVIENSAVRHGFIVELRNSLQAKNFAVRTLDPLATTNACHTVVTYNARWRWDLTIYMAYAEISVYQEGRMAGNALYDATSGSGRLDKFVDAEPKIRELVNELFPDTYKFHQVGEDTAPWSMVGQEMVSDIQTEEIEFAIDTDRSPDIYEELLKLDDLRKRGILTDAEFEIEKRQLLDAN